MDMRLSSNTISSKEAAICYSAASNVLCTTDTENQKTDIFDSLYVVSVWVVWQLKKYLLFNLTRGSRQRCDGSHMPHHSAWILLFNDPDFWLCLGKSGFMLRLVCKEFHSDIPEPVAIRAIFRSTLCRKVDLFRLLPLSVNDVVRMRSPVNFVAAFDIAVRRWGSFESCMAFVREWGWVSWRAANMKRRLARERINGFIKTAGLVDPIDVDNPVYVSAISNRKRVDRAVVWRYSCTFEGLLPREQYDPYQSANGVVLSRMAHSNMEFKSLLCCLHDAIGFWYKGIRCDARNIETFIRGIRSGVVLGPGKNVVQHQIVSGGVLVVGVITFSVWK